MTCRVCDVVVPSGEFCGNCGATRIRRRGDGPSPLRMSAYSAAPRERLLSPSVTSTIFPALPRHSRTVFGLALIGVVALMLGTALLMWQAALIGLVGFGLPLLFVVYLRKTDAFTDLSVGALATTAVLGIVFGIGWGLATDVAAARTDDDALGLPVSVTKVLITGLAVPLSFVILALTPMVLVRILRPGIRESLNGFIFGTLAALLFTSAGSLTRLAPQLSAGPIDDDGRSPVHLVIAGVIQGLAVPLTAAAVGGAIGATLWFTPRADSQTRPRWYAVPSPAPAVAFGVVLYLGLGLLDFFQPSNAVEMVVYGLLAALALCALRVVVHATLLLEEPDHMPSGEVISCPQCERTVPDLPFCPRCGVAGHAASRTSRAARRSAGPVPAGASPTRVLLIVGVGAVLVMASSIALSSRLVPPVARFVCPPDCGQPPISRPVFINPRFTSASGAFSVSYPGPQTAYDAVFQDNGVVLNLSAGDGGTLRLFGQPANGQTPRQIANDLLQQHYPDAIFSYEIPNAFVGYQLGYGEVADDYPADAIGDDGRNRILIMAAVKNGYALIAAAAGPYHEFSPDFGSGHPSGANFFLALDMSKYVNSFTWRGDPAR